MFCSLELQVEELLPELKKRRAFARIEQAHFVHDPLEKSFVGSQDSAEPDMTAEEHVMKLQPQAAAPLKS